MEHRHSTYSCQNLSTSLYPCQSVATSAIIYRLIIKPKEAVPLFYAPTAPQNAILDLTSLMIVSMQGFVQYVMMRSAKQGSTE